MAQLFTNNAATTLTAGISNSTPTIPVANGAVFPSITGSDHFLATLILLDSNGNETAWEIVKVTARIGNNLTVLRGQEGTTALAWANASRIEARVTAASIAAKANADEVRTKLSFARIYYVSTSGSDSNAGLSPDSPLRTIQHAVTLACSLDNGGFAVTIQLADGTYSEVVSFLDIVGNGSLTIQGNAATPANVICQVFSGSYVHGTYRVKDLKLSDGSMSVRLQAIGGGIYLGFSNLIFGAATSQHIVSANGASIVCEGNYTISGSCPIHLYAASGSIEVRAKTVTLTGAPVFSSGFAFTQFNGNMLLDGNVFSGATGASSKRYAISTNGVIYVAGASTFYLPGTVAGTTATGGQYA